MKYTALLTAISLLFGGLLNAQAVNQPANWPSTDWTLTILENTTGDVDIEADPTMVASFAFDDDDTGENSHEVLTVESPVIDLTAAQLAGENLITISGDYSYNWVQIEEYLAIEYWDADSVDWELLYLFPSDDVPGIGIDNFCEAGKETYFAYFDITEFSAAQLSSFRYRYFYNDDVTGGDGYNWGFCFDSPTLVSSSDLTIPGCATNPFPGDFSIGDVLIGTDGNVFSWDAPTTGDAVSTYDLYFGTTVDNATDLVSSVVETEDIIYFTAGEYGLTYTWKVVPKNGGGEAVDCPVWTYTVESLGEAPDNDNCDQAVSLTVGDVFEDNSMEATSIGSTSSEELPMPSCGLFGNGQDVWYSVVVPASGDLTIETQEGEVLDAVMSVYSGSCGSLTELDCNDDALAGGTLMSTLSFTGLTPGEVLMVRVFEFGNDLFGTYTISAYDDYLVGVASYQIARFDVFPNPVDNILNVNGESDIKLVSIYNSIGQQVYHDTPNAKSIQIDFSKYNTGAYTIQLDGEDGRGLYKFIKE